MNITKYYNHIHLHFIVFLYGFTAIIGKMLTAEALTIVLYRMLIASAGLYIYIRYKKYATTLDKKSLYNVLGVGAIVAIHWITFFHAIKISNVSVTLGCLAATTLITSFLEPIVNKRRIFWLEVLIGMFIIVGLYLIFQFETRYKYGIIVALTSAFAAGMFTVLNKKLIKTHNANVISLYEMLAGTIGVFLYMLATGNITSHKLYVTNFDIILLLILGLVCTSYAFAATINIMKELSAYFVVLSINMEPIYGIILAFLIFGDSEHMTAGFYGGTAIILSSVFLYPVIKRLLKRKTKNLQNIENQHAV